MSGPVANSTMSDGTARNIVLRRDAAHQNGGNMKILFASVLLAAMVAGFGAASAAEGCGPGMHRGPEGRCFPNRGDVVVVERPAVVVVRPGRVCPVGFSWRYGRCRPL
jgi:hypothetical protein